MTLTADEIEVYGPQTTCICPKCHKKHKMKMRWIVNGIPRKFCNECRAVAEKHETAQFGAVVGANHAFGWSIRVATR